MMDLASIKRANKNPAAHARSRDEVSERVPARKTERERVTRKPKTRKR